MRSPPFAPLLLTGFSCLASLNACKPHSDRSTVASNSALPVATVQVATATLSSLGSREEIIGTVRPVLSAGVSAKVSGTISQVPVVAGQSVKAGDLLAQIDAREVQARVDQAQASAVESRQERDRVERLFATRAASQKEVDSAIARADAAEGALAEARAMLDYTRITAPFDGVVVRKLCDVGDLAQPGRLLFEVEDPRALRLEAEVPEQLSERLALGDTLPVRIDAANFDGEGRVEEIESAIRGASRTLLTKIALPTHEGLRSGQFGRATLKLQGEGGVIVPEAAVVERGQLDLVLIVEKDVARLRLVRIGRREKGNVEVLAGIDPGERVVVTAPGKLTDGQTVVVR